MATTHFVVLGGGLVGSFIARQLAAGEAAAVTLADRDKQALKQAAALAPVNISGADLSNPDTVAKVVRDADVVVGALPGHLGYRALAAVIKAGKPCVDISFFPEDARELDELASKQGVPAIVDCGVMPGLGGMLVAELAGQLEDVESAGIMVGGLPVERRWPMEYRAPFSPVDVIEEYTRPARLRQGGELVVRPALSDVELIHFTELGTLEAFNTDGLRSLLYTTSIPNLSEKTLRYPGHAQRVLLLKELGFFSEEKLQLAGGEIAPIELTSRLLIDAWQLEHGMLEFTIMRVEVSGRATGQPQTFRCELLDRTDPVTGDFSMARTTGWPAVLVARLLADGGGQLRSHSGIMFPEQLVAQTGVYQAVTAGLEAAGIELKYRAL